MSPFPASKGHLNPAGPVTMTRLPPGPEAVDLVRHYWIPQWDLPPGSVRRQLVLGYPACNLVVEPGVVTLAGPTTTLTHRDLGGRGWAVGALLRPAAGPLVLASGMFAGPVGVHENRTVADVLDRELAATSPSARRLRREVSGAMDSGDVRGAVDALEALLISLRPRVSADGLLANRLQEVVETTPVRQVGELARALAVSTRSLERLARVHIGVTPSAMVRRRRLQDAADKVRRNPGADLATVAADAGYADHAHLTRDFRDVLGFTPSQYRSGLAGSE